MLSIITLTLNPALDITYQLDELDPQQVNKVTAKWLHPGGKGINVAKVLAALGEEPVCWTMLGGYTGNQILELLEPQPFPVKHLKIGSVSRQNIKLQVQGRYIEINEPGPVIIKAELKAFEDLFFPSLVKAKILVLSGSLPQGIPDDYYARLILEAGKLGLKVILDTSGEPLRQALASGVFLVKPNRSELEALLGRELPTPVEIVEGARQVVAAGAKNVLVSLGGQGALLVNDGGVWESKPPRVHLTSPLGAGDSMVAGCAAYLARTEDYNYPQMLREATAAGTAAVEKPGSLEPDQQRIRELLGEVIVRKRV